MTEQTDKSEVILIDKPLTWTSFDVVNKIKHLRIYKKIGHAGTLDPLATGLLILCTDKFTKRIEEFQAQEKGYTGSLVLGKTTPSVDLETEFDGEYPIDHINESAINEAIRQLSGEIQQVPPAHSAIQINGKRAYEMARKGQEVIIKPRTVTVKEFEIDIKDFPTVHFRIVCSKGTYIRSLVRDFGQLLGSGAYMSALRRTRIGDFKVENALKIEEFVESKKKCS